MDKTTAIQKIKEIQGLSEKESGFGYLAAAVAWLLKDRIDQMLEQVQNQK